MVRGFETSRDLFRELSPLIDEDDWQGNLDLLDDVLHERYGLPKDGFVLRWINSDVSRQRLGYGETVKWFKAKVKRRQGVREDVEGGLHDAQAEHGPTLFDIIVEIIRDHGPGGAMADDGIELELA